MPVPNIYEDTSATHGTGALSVPWGTHNDTFTAVLVVTCAGGDTLGAPTQSGADGTWALIASCAEGTGAGSIQIGAYWCRATTGSMSNVTVPDAGDHTSAKMFMLQNVVASGNPINMYATQTVGTATASISFACPDTTVANCLVFCLAGCGFDQTTSPGGSGWTNAALSSIGFGGQYCTNNGTGGGYMGGVGSKATAGSCGTFTHTWASGATKQANIIFAISDTATAGGSPGSAAGTGAAGAAGQAVAGAAGSASGSSTAGAAGASASAAAGSIAGTGAAAGAGASTSASPGAASGAGAASAAGAAISAGAGAATGTGSAAAAIIAIAAGEGASAGTSSAAGAAASVAAGAGSASGAASVVGFAPGDSSGAAGGTGTATAGGAAIASTSGSASGSATVGAGAGSIAAGAGAASGSASATAEGDSETSEAAGVGSASGTGTAGAVASTIAAATGSAAGTSSDVAVGNGGVSILPRTFTVTVGQGTSSDFAVAVVAPSSIADFTVEVIP